MFRYNDFSLAINAQYLELLRSIKIFYSQILLTLINKTFKCLAKTVLLVIVEKLLKSEFVFIKTYSAVNNP